MPDKPKPKSEPKDSPFKSMTKNELVDQAHARGIINPEAKTKDELIEEIEKV